MSAPHRKPGRRVWPLALALLVAPIAFLVASLRTAGMPDFEAACEAGEPYVVAAVYRAQTGNHRPPSAAAPSVVLFRDTPEDRVHQQLASFSQVGAVWGLAYSRAERAVYAATFHKRALPYGPEGAGGIYRIDLKSGAVTTFAVVPDAGGRSRKLNIGGGNRNFDQADNRHVGRSALGGLDIDPSERELAVVNLRDRRIHRYDLATGQPLGSFDNGAAGEPWARGARPFAVTWHGGFLLHGVVNEDGRGADFVARVYRSRPDGSDMTVVAEVDLRYRREKVHVDEGQLEPPDTVDWAPWTDQVSTVSDRGELHPVQPMLTDIAVTDGGRMVLGLRDRYWDLINGWVDELYVPPNWVSFIREAGIARQALGFCDVLLGLPNGEGYRFQLWPEPIADANAVGHEESAFGGLACRRGSETVIFDAYGVESVDTYTILGYEGAYWHDLTSGNRMAKEVVGRPGSFQPYADLLERLPLRARADNERIRYLRDVASLGDLEAICEGCGPPAPPTPTATGTPTDTPSPTPTVTPTATMSPRPTASLTATVPPTATRSPAYLPLLLRERCDPEIRRVDVALVVDASLSMLEPAGGGSPGTKLDSARSAAAAFLDSLAPGRGDQAAIVAFNAQATVLAQLTDDRATLDAAVAAIAPAAQTCIFCGINAAAIELASARHRPDHAAVIVLLTDGRSNPQPASEAVDRAEVAKRVGIAIFTVGLGDDLDEAALVEIASRPQDYRHAPSGAELGAIYRSIAAEIPCARELFWGGR